MFVEYVIAGYGISAVVLASYVGWTLRRGRALFARVEPPFSQQHPESVPASPLGSAGYG